MPYQNIVVSIIQGDVYSLSWCSYCSHLWTLHPWHWLRFSWLESKTQSSADPCWGHICSWCDQPSTICFEKLNTAIHTRSIPKPRSEELLTYRAQLPPAGQMRGPIITLLSLNLFTVFLLLIYRGRGKKNSPIPFHFYFSLLVSAAFYESTTLKAFSLSEIQRAVSSVRRSRWTQIPSVEEQSCCITSK